jgi:Spy/CpxP family protein refolding chaperone
MTSLLKLGCIAALAFLSLTFGSATALADEVDAKELAEARKLLKSGREELVREELQLTESEAAAFWPLYKEYRDDIERVRNRQAEMVSTYVEAYWAAELNDELAKNVLDTHFAIKGDVVKIEKRYLRRFRKVLSSGKVTLFYQLENKLDAEIDYLLADLIPLYDPS